jgi:hypothetical protein
VIQYKRDFVRFHLKPAMEKAKFDFLAARFYDEDVTVRDVPGDKEFPRETPYAYVLLKAKDPALDVIPAIKFDMDFNDGFGDVILPAKTDEIRLTLRAAEPPPRPVDGLVVSQKLSLDGPEGRRLRLEVNAKGFGAVPEKVGDLLEMGALAYVDEPSPLTGSGFDLSSGRARVERSWSLTPLLCTRFLGIS